MLEKLDSYEAGLKLDEGKVVFSEEEDRYFWKQKVTDPLGNEDTLTLYTEKGDDGEYEIHEWCGELMSDDYIVVEAKNPGTVVPSSNGKCFPYDAIEKMKSGTPMTDGDNVYSISTMSRRDGNEIYVVQTYSRIALDSNPSQIETDEAWKYRMRGQEFWEYASITAGEAAKAMDDGDAVKSNGGITYYRGFINFDDETWVVGAFCKGCNGALLYDGPLEKFAENHAGETFTLVKKEDSDE